eukprot:2664450-Pleurochrysis_carterae.AAC.1
MNARAPVGVGADLSVGRCARPHADLHRSQVLEHLPMHAYARSAFPASEAFHQLHGWNAAQFYNFATRSA